MVKHYCDLCGAEIKEDYLINKTNGIFHLPGYFERVKEYWPFERELCVKCCQEMVDTANQIRKRSREK